MNLKTTIQTLRRIEQLLDGWQSSGDIPTIERDLACDLLRRAYDDIFFSNKNAATASEALLAENAPTDRMNEKTGGEVADAQVDAATAAGDDPVAGVVSPVGLVGLAPSGEPAERKPEESSENAEAVEEPTAKNASMEAPTESPAEEDVPVVTPVNEPAEEDASVVTPVDKPAAAEESAVELASAKESVVENIPIGTSVGESVEENTPVEMPDDEPASVEASIVEPASAEESVEENISIRTSFGEPAEEDTSVDTPIGAVAEDEIPVEEFGEAGDAVEESGDTVSPAEDVAVSIPETSADVVIDPVFEVFTGEGEDAGGPDDAEEQEDTEASETLDLAKTVNVVEAVDVAGAAEDTEIAGELGIVKEMDAEEIEVVEDMEAGETEIERPAAASAAIRPAVATVEPNAESGPESVLASAPEGTSIGKTRADADTSTEEAPTDAATSNAETAETLEEMAARFKNASGRRRKSRRAFLSLYDDDETARRGAPNDQLELSDWGVEPLDSSAKLRHTRELFGLPVDDLDTTSEPAPQPAAESDAADDEIEVEVIDFAGDDDLAQSNRNAKPASESPIRPATKPVAEPSAEPTQQTSHPTVAPAYEVRDDADDDLSFDEAIVTLEDLDDVPDPDDAPSAVPPLEPIASPEHSESPESSDAVPFDSIEIADIDDIDEEVHGVEEDDTQHTDSLKVADEPAKSEATVPATPAAESAAAHSLYGHEEKPELPVSTTVLGEVMGHDVPTVGDTLGHDAPTVGDTLGRRPDVAGWTEVADDLNHAISVGDRFVLLRDLFDGDQAMCDRTLKRLSTFDDLDDCMIWITENFAWNANSEGAKLIMGLLERKLG